MNWRFNIRKYTLFMIFIFSIQLIGLSATASSKTVRVGVYQNNPLSFIEENGKVKGFFIDILEYIASEEGWQIEYNHCSWSECLSNLKDGSIELLGVIAYSESRGKVFNYTNESVITNWGQMYLSKGSDIESIIDLEGKIVAVLHGDIYFENLKKLVDQFGIQCRFIEAFEYEDVLELVEIDRCEAGMVSQFYGLQHERDYDIAKSPILVSPKKLYWATAKGKNSELLYSLDRHLKTLKEDEQSTYKQAINKWFGIGAKSIFGKWIKWIIITFSFLLVLFFLANVMLGIKVRSRTKELLAKNVALINEIKTRKQAERNVIKERDFISNLLYWVNSLVVVVDLAGDLVSFNRSSEQLSGYRLEDLQGKPFWETLLAPDERDGVKATINDVHQKQTPKDFLNHWVTKTGEKRLIQWNNSVLKNEDGSIGYILCTGLDITERKKAESALIRSEAKYRELVQNANSMILRIDTKGNLTFFNEYAEKFFGYKAEEIVGKNILGTILPETDSLGYNLANLVSNIKEHPERYVSNENENMLKNGQRAWVAWTNKAIYDQEGRVKGILCIGNDITERKSLEQKLQQSQKMDALGTLSGGIAHEFNNILGIIIGNTELAIDDVPEWNSTKDYLEEIHTASLRAKDVVRQIMSFSRKTSVTREPINVGSIIQESLKLMRATIPTNVEIRLEILCKDEMILANPTEINQILINLCRNSVHAMEEETGNLMIRLKTVILDNRSAAQYEDLMAGEYVKLTVKDDGTGIDPEQIGLIFDPYFTTKDFDKGLGMGMSVVYGIVKKHDGAIKVKSKVGKGTTVEVLFPVTEEMAEITEKDSDELPRGTERILFVDDEAPLVKMVKQMLERQGYEVVGTTSSTNALKMFQKESDKFELVVTDMAMPEMPGDHLAQKLIKIRPNIPIIICTGHSDRVDEEKAIKSGIAAYTIKPLVKKNLVNTVRKVLDDAKGSTQA